MFRQVYGEGVAGGAVVVRVDADPDSAEGFDVSDGFSLHEDFADDQVVESCFDEVSSGGFAFLDAVL